MHAYFGLVLILGLVTVTCAQRKKNGEDIADALYKHPDECKDPNDGGIWAPLAEGSSCGNRDCKYPEEWCSARSSSRSVPQFSCVKLTDECIRALAKDDAKEAKSAKDIKSAGGKSTKSIAQISTTSKPTSTAKSTKTTWKPNRSTVKAKTTTEKSIEKEEATERTTAEAKTETTTLADSSEEIETTRRTRKPNRFRGRPEDAKPRKEEKEEDGAGVQVKPAEKPADDCKDSSPLCCFWAANIHPLGTECDRNAFWMRTNCQKSCGTCGCQASNFQSCRVNINTAGCPFLQAGTNNLVFVPVASQGGPFSFPTVGGSGGPVSVPVGNRNGNGFNPAFAPFQNSAFRQQQNFGPSPVVVPLAAGKR